jgi:transcription-repair coupling factor (superfamily II helicase)
MGAKDMSTIETPPPNRVPVETTICGYDERIIRDAITRELARQGQVYFLHNRIETIQRVTERLQTLVPKARILSGHGQMEEHQLEDVMKTFVEGRADILVSTTIIESGLDIPNANTIIIDRADRFGLADLYQLRGRVGRANQKAYAYLMLPRDLMTVSGARKRINAIKQYSSLGAGFKIAMRDLEIRGAGNILGTAQSGHIITIGFDLYCSLLRQAVSTLKGEKVKPRLEVALRLEFLSTRESDTSAEPASPPPRHRPSAYATSDTPSPNGSRAPAFLPASYISDSSSRIQAYRRLNEVSSQEQLDELRKTWRDRFGPLPSPVENLVLMTEIKLSAAARKFTSVEVKDEKIMLQRGGDYVLLGAKFPRLSARDPAEKLRELLALVRSF